MPENDFYEPEGLWDCIAAGDIARVREILEEDPRALHAPVRYSERFLGGDQAIHIACRRGNNIPMIALLLEKGATLEDMNKSCGYTPFGAAAKANHPELMKYLIGRGADINAPGCDHLPPLCDAAARENALLVGRLLEFGADINVTDGKGYTPLMHALSRQRAPAARELLAAGARLDPVAKDGATAESLAAEAVKADPAFAGIYGHIVSLREQQEEKARRAEASRIGETALKSVDMRGKAMPALKFRRP